MGGAGDSPLRVRSLNSVIEEAVKNYRTTVDATIDHVANTTDTPRYKVEVFQVSTYSLAISDPNATYGFYVNTIFGFETIETVTEAWNRI